MRGGGVVPHAVEWEVNVGSDCANDSAHQHIEAHALHRLSLDGCNNVAEDNSAVDVR